MFDCDKNEKVLYPWNASCKIRYPDIMMTDEINPTFTLFMELISFKDNKGESININDYQQMNNNHLIFSPVSKMYKWKLDNFKADNCKYTTSFRSDAFNIDGFDFMLEFYPRISMHFSDAYDETDETYLILHVVRLPMNISSISVIYLLRLEETDTNYWCADVIGRNENKDSIHLTLHRWEWDDVLISQPQDLTTLTFSCNIQIINAYNTDKDCIVYQDNDNKQQEVDPDIEYLTLYDPQSFELKVSKSQIENLSSNSETIIITSKIFTLFGIKWYLMFVPDHNLIEVYLGIADFPLNISDIAIYYKCAAIELNEYISSNSVQLTDNHHYCKLDIVLEEVSDEFTINLEMILTTVYDDNGNDVTNKYIECKTNDLDDGEDEEDKKGENNHYKWNITNLDAIVESSYYVFSEDEIEFKIELDLRKENRYNNIYIILKSMPLHLKQLSIKCDIKIEEINANISGFVHFKRGGKLRALIDSAEFELEDIEEMTILLNMNLIAKYQ